jgi:hypothetical protein
MYAPNDPLLRDRWNTTLRKLPELDADIAHAAVKQLQNEMLRVTSRKDGVPMGRVAALIPFEVLRTGGGIEKAKTAITEEMRSRGIKGASHTIIERDWIQCRDAAHLWFADAFYPRSVASRSTSALLAMLSLADAVRLKAEVHITGNQRRPLLDPERAWAFRLPEGMALSPAEGFDLRPFVAMTFPEKTMDVSGDSCG